MPILQSRSKCMSACFFLILSSDVSGFYYCRGHPLSARDAMIDTEPGKIPVVLPTGGHMHTNPSPTTTKHISTSWWQTTSLRSNFHSSLTANDVQGCRCVQRAGHVKGRVWDVGLWLGKTVSLIPSTVHLEVEALGQLPSIKTWALRRATLPVRTGRYNCTENHCKSAPEGSRSMGMSAAVPCGEIC